MNSTATDKHQKRLASALLGSLAAYLVWSLAGFDSIITMPVLFALFAALSALHGQVFHKESKSPSWLLLTHRVALVLLVPALAWSVYRASTTYFADIYYASALSLQAQGTKKRSSAVLLEAEKSLQRAMELNSHEVTYPLTLADLYATLYGFSKNQSFLQAASQWVRSYDKHPWPHGQYYNATMKLMFARQQYSQALQFAKEMLKTIPYSHVVHGHIGYIHLLQAQYSEAKKYLTTAIKLQPSSVVANASLAEIYMFEGNYQFARKHAKAALGGAVNEPQKNQIKTLIKKIEETGYIQ